MSYPSSQTIGNVLPSVRSVCGVTDACATERITHPANPGMMSTGSAGRSCSCCCCCCCCGCCQVNTEVLFPASVSAERKCTLGIKPLSPLSSGRSNGKRSEMGDVLLIGMGEALLAKWETPFFLSPGNDPIPSTGGEFRGSPPEVVLSDKLIGQRISEALPPPLSSTLIGCDDGHPTNFPVDLFLAGE